VRTIEINKLQNSIESRVNIPKEKLKKVLNERQSDKKLKDGKKLTKDVVDKQIEELNKKAEIVNKNIEFDYHEDAEQMMVKIKNTKTNEVIKEIPPEDMVELNAKIKEMVGIILDELR